MGFNAKTQLNGEGKVHSLELDPRIKSLIDLLDCKILNIGQMTKTDILKDMYVSNSLEKEDVYKHQHYVIITRSGIEKIQAKNNISVTFSLEHVQKDFVVVKATAVKEGAGTIETFGSASPETSHNKYYPEMAEKRALSRAVLKIMGLYKYGVFGEDEADDFKQQNK